MARLLGVNLLLDVMTVGSVALVVHTQTGQRLTRTVAVLAVAVAVFAGEPIGTDADIRVGSWTPSGSMPQAWARGLAVALSNGRVLAVAGDTERISTDLYEPSTGIWTEEPDVPVSAASSTLVALAHGGALLVGGAACGRPENIAEYRCLPTASTYRLSSTGSVWSPVASMLEARANPTAVRLADGRVLVVGGFGRDCPPTFAHGYSCQPLATAEIFDPVSGQWSTTAPMPQARGGARATLLSDGTVLVVGGYDGQEAIRYDAGTGNWTAAGETATPRTGSLLFTLPGDRALALEGDEPYAGFFGSLGTAAKARPPRCNPSSETFAAAFNAWMVSLTEPAGSSQCPNGALLAGGQILLTSVLNYSQSGSALTSPFLLDARQRCWSTTAPPIVQRDYGAVVPLPDGRALVFGGYDANSPGNLPRLSSGEIYAPGSPTCTAHPILPPEPPGRPTGSPRFTGATISHRRHLALTAAGLIRVLEHCPGRAARRCLGHVQLALAVPPARAKTKRHAIHLFLGEAPFVVPAGQTGVAIVRVTKNKRALIALLRRVQRATIIVTTSAYEEAGQTATTTASAMLREQPHRIH
jgi:Kelch motif